MKLCAEHADESTENIDEIVQDHDNFGTDENEDDSLGSSPVVMRPLGNSSASDWQLKLMTGLKHKYDPSSSSAPSTSSSSEHRLSVPKGEIVQDLLGLRNSALGGAVDNLDNVTLPKRKRDTFSEQEQEVCQLTGALLTKEASEVIEVAEVESISSIPQEPPKELQPWLDSFSSWTHAQRLLAIDQLINRCHPTQVRHMMAVIEPQFQR